MSNMPDDVRTGAPTRRNDDPAMAHHRGRVASLRRAGRHHEADTESRLLRARGLFLTAQKAMAVEPPLLADEVELIVAVLRGETDSEQS